MMDKKCYITNNSPRLKRDSFQWSKSDGEIIQVEESDASMKFFIASRQTLFSAHLPP